MPVAGFFERGPTGIHADFSVVGCDEYSERKLPPCTTLSCSRQEEEWEIIYRLVNDGKESKTYSRPLCTDIP